MVHTIPVNHRLHSSQLCILYVSKYNIALCDITVGNCTVDTCPQVHVKSSETLMYCIEIKFQNLLRVPYTYYESTHTNIYCNEKTLKILAFVIYNQPTTHAKTCTLF